jgi:uncharacterized protein YigA (DUF484 family)
MTTKKAQAKELQLVRDYLIDHPTFFEDNPDVLEAINVSHDSGKAISLVERQVTVMRDKNKVLSGQLEQLIETAKNNDQLLAKTNQLVLKLIQAEDLNSLITVLDTSLKNDFNTEFYSLTLIDKGLFTSKTAANLVLEEEAKSKISSLLSAQKAVSGVLREEQINFLFEQSANNIASVIALPLNSSEPFGILALGSSDADFYSHDIGTVFIDYIGALLNELIPKHFKD